jgi:hypothetical protein
MAATTGENLVPLGVSGTGAAFTLGNDLAPLRILEQGARTRALAAERARLAKVKADQDNAKQFNDFAKFEQDGSPYFGDSLNKRVYKPAMEQLIDVTKNNRDDLLARNFASQPILQRTNNETVQSKAKTKYLTDAIRGYQGDKALYNAQYIGENLSKSLRGEDGTTRLPSEFDEEGWNDSVKGDHQAYNEPEVVRRATAKLMPAISQKVSEAGSIGGQHTADQVRGRFVAFDGKGHPILNADKTPKIALSADTQAILEEDPLFKLKLDAREAAYNEKRAADPSLPNMSRRGHISQMIGPLVYYSQDHDEGLNRLPPQPKTAKANPKELIATPTTSRQTSYYNQPGSQTQLANHYATVGRSLGTAAGPGIQVEANNGDFSILGANGEVTRPNTAQANGRVPVQLLNRGYVLYAKGKRLGSDKPFQTDEEARQATLNLIKTSAHPEDLELRVMGHGVLKDRTRTAGDGLGGPPKEIGKDKHGKPVYDTSTTETQHNVLVPITQEIDAQLRRASGNKYEPRATTPQESELINAVKARGGRLITPYNNVQPRAAAPSTSTAKAQRPAWLQPKATTKQAPSKSNAKAADASGGMLD